MGKFNKQGNRNNTNRPNNFQHKKVHGNNFKRQQSNDKVSFQHKNNNNNNRKPASQGAVDHNSRKPYLKPKQKSPSFGKGKSSFDHKQTDNSTSRKYSEVNESGAVNNAKPNRGFQRYQQKKNRQNNQQKEQGEDNSEEPTKIHYVLHPAKLKRLQEAVKDQNMSRREQKQKEYKQAKYKKMTILNQKTSKGQPLMNGRMKLLYEKIQKNYDRENKQ